MDPASPVHRQNRLADDLALAQEMDGGEEIVDRVAGTITKFAGDP